MSSLDIDTCMTRPLALVNQVGITLRPSRKLSVQALEEARLGSIDKESVEKIQETIAGGPLDRPTRPQFFVADKNLFRGQVDSSAAVAEASPADEWPGRGAWSLKVFEITERVEQAVRMINANS